MPLNAGRQRWFDWNDGETTTGYPSSFEERDPTPLGDNVVSQGKMIVHYRIGSER